METNPTTVANKASLPIHNAQCRVLQEKGKEQTVALLVGQDDRGNGMLVANHARAMVAAVIATLAACFIVRGGKRGFAAIAGGLRFVLDSATGQGAPLFVERKGASTGEVYIFGGAEKRVALLAALPEGCVAAQRVETKGGLYLTFTDCDEGTCTRILDVLESPLYRSNASVTNWRSDMGASVLMLADGSIPTETPIAPRPEQPKKEGKKAGPEDKRHNNPGRPKGSKGKPKADDSIPQAS